MEALLPLTLVWGTAIAVSLAVTGIVAAAGLGDAPGPRSSHTRLTPTAGGLGMVAALGAGALLPDSAALVSPQIAPLLAILFGVAMVGLIDDAVGMRARVKFALLLLLAAAAVWVIGPVAALPLGEGVLALPAWAGAAGAVLWLFVITNAVNFMDGINGIMAGTVNAALLGFAGIAGAFGATDALFIAALLSGGLLGLLPYNYRTRAHVFAGDTGALLAGFAFGLLPLLLESEVASYSARTPALLYIGPLLLLPFLADVFTTLIRRAREGKPLLSAHREHLYQYAARRIGHLPVASAYLATTLPLTLLALWAIATGRQGSLVLLLALSALVGWGFYRGARKLERAEAMRAEDMRAETP